MIPLDRSYGVVLEGGGAKGAYQVGAWKALRETGIKIRGVVGSSVGSLNGVMMVMDDFTGTWDIWSHNGFEPDHHHGGRGTRKGPGEGEPQKDQALAAAGPAFLRYPGDGYHPF